MTSPLEVSTWLEDLVFDWSRWAASARSLSLVKDEWLFQQGDDATSVYAVREGRIRLTVISPTGEEKTTAIIGKNGIVGEPGLFDGEVHTVGAATSTNALLWVWPAQTFKDAVRESPSLTDFVLLNMARKLRILAAQTVELSYSSAQYRVVKSLLELASTYGVSHANATGSSSCTLPGRDAPVRINMRFTHQEMANLAGATRVTVAQVFKSLESDGLLTRQDGYFIVPTVARLRQLLDHPKLSHFKRNTHRANAR